METFKCNYYVFKTSTFEEIPDHCSVIHEDELLKYRELVLDEATGIVSYQMKAAPNEYVTSTFSSGKTR